MNFLKASIIELMWRKEQTVTSHRPGHWRRGRIYWKKESWYLLSFTQCEALWLVCISDSLCNSNIKTLRGRFYCFLLKNKTKQLWEMSHIFPNCEKLLYLFFFICSEFCHTLKWNSYGFTCVPHHDPPSNKFVLSTFIMI